MILSICCIINNLLQGYMCFWHFFSTGNAWLCISHYWSTFNWNPRTMRSNIWNFSGYTVLLDHLQVVRKFFTCTFGLRRTLDVQFVQIAHPGYDVDQIWTKCMRTPCKWSSNTVLIILKIFTWKSKTRAVLKKRLAANENFQNKI